MAIDKIYRSIDEKLDRIMALLEPQAHDGNPADAPPAPFDGYDGMNVAEALDMLKSQDDATRIAALAYERSNKKRATVIDALENWNS